MEYAEDVREKANEMFMTAMKNLIEQTEKGKVLFEEGKVTFVNVAPEEFQKLLASGINVKNVVQSDSGLLDVELNAEEMLLMLYEKVKAMFQQA